ncbi:MAG: monovalent cation:proton antiporter-2 (CPA2) family protein [Bdellovibrionales bacterium]|nr:monovalent cation:proton antiporter-2 (CPA2) family protein [Bdellovibrionales bacterium]
MSSFIEQALVFIGAAVILVPLFQKLRFGSVLGYLMAGIVVGPFALKLIPESESVIHFSELGVVFLLFIIGLEIQPKKLWSMRKHLFGLGGMQIALSSAVFTGIAMACGLSAVLAAVIGFALSLSSTAFALQTLSERNQLNTEFGRGSFSVLLMQDLVAIPALALIPSLGAVGGEESPSPLRTLAMAAAVIAFLLIASRLLIRPAFRLIASTRTREIFTAATLFLVLGVAVLMQKAGLSAALGAFIAGVLLADSEFRHELEADIEPFKSMLMGLFFIGVGLGVSLPLIFSRPSEVFGLALGYLAIKGLLIYFSARLFRLSHENAKQIALTISQGGEFAFVIFGIALHANIAPEQTVVLLTAVITISMALSPVLNVFGGWASQRWRKVAAPEWDVIQDEAPQVIIAGFGRFGQIFGRILRAQGIGFVAIDHDAEQIELLRKFGNKVYYGDASREDILRAAGAERAKFFILAVDDVEASLETARRVQEYFPHLRIFARARNRGHAFDLMEIGVKDIKREVFDSSVYFTGDLLVALGIDPVRAADLIERFKRHDEIMLEEQFKVRHDNEGLISVSKQGVLQLEQVLAEDSTRTYVDSSR